MANHLEIDDDLSQYTTEQLQPEIHIVLPLVNVPAFIDEDVCILDSDTSHTILIDKQYFQQILPSNRPVTTITRINHLEEGHGLPNYFYQMAHQLKFNLLFTPHWQQEISLVFMIYARTTFIFDLHQITKQILYRSFKIQIQSPLY